MKFEARRGKHAWNRAAATFVVGDAVPLGPLAARRTSQPRAAPPPDAGGRKCLAERPPAPGFPAARGVAPPAASAFRAFLPIHSLGGVTGVAVVGTRKGALPQTRPQSEPA